MRVNRLLQLQQIAQVRERRALRECQARHQAHLAAGEARQAAVAVVHGLRRERDEVMTEVWQRATVTGHDLQAAVQRADHLAQQQKTAQRKVVQAEAVETEAQAHWAEARAVQADALRTCHKLDHARDAEAAVERRSVERRAAQRHDDDGPTRTWAEAAQ